MCDGSRRTGKASVWPAVPRLLRLTVALVLSLVFVRLLHLQLVVAPVVTHPESPLDIRSRRIPPRRGEIVTRDGIVLARTRAQTVIAVHYRVLQRPLDRRWLEAWFRGRYPELRGEARIAAATAEVARLIPRLAELTGVPEHVLQARAARIRRHVTRIKRVVARRLGLDSRRARQAQQGGGLLTRLLRLFAEPEPRALDPAAGLVIKEETWFYPLAAIEGREAVAEVLAHLEELPGVRIEQRSAREYPQGTLACHVVGYVTRRSRDAEGEFAGVSGVEAYYDGMLAGKPGELREQRRPDGSWEVLSGRPPRPGARLVLTIDSRLQRAAERFLAEACTNGLPESTGGAVLVMEASTGAIRAVASYPPFAPGMVTQANSSTSRRRGGAPLLARFHQAALPPGSLFKLVVALAALHSGAVDVREPIACRGYFGPDPNRHRCWIYAEHGKSHGLLTLPEAIGHSCNCYFFQLGVRLGAGRLTSMAELLGVGHRTGIDLAGENAGQLPRLPVAGGDRLPVDLLNVSIGQGELLVTPVQVARWTAAIVTGYLVRPHVSAGAFAPRERLPVSDEAREAILEGMRLAVVMPWGTAHAQLGRLPVPVRAKTGTSEAGTGPPHSWCVAILGEGESALVVVALVEHGGKGSERAASLVRQIVELITPDAAADRNQAVPRHR